MTRRPSASELYTSGVTRSVRVLAPMWWMRMIGVPARSPPTCPSFARNSAMTLLGELTGHDRAPGRNAVGQVDATGGGGLAVDEFQVLSPGDPAQQRRARPDGDRVHAQAKLVQQRFVDQAPDQASTTDDVDGPAGLRFERAQLVEVANDPRGGPGGIAKGCREHQVRSFGRDAARTRSRAGTGRVPATPRRLPGPLGSPSRTPRSRGTFRRRGQTRRLGAAVRGRRPRSPPSRRSRPGRGCSRRA